MGKETDRGKSGGAQPDTNYSDESISNPCVLLGSVLRSCRRTPPDPSDQGVREVCRLRVELVQALDVDLFRTVRDAPTRCPDFGVYAGCTASIRTRSAHPKRTCMGRRASGPFRLRGPSGVRGFTSAPVPWASSPRRPVIGDGNFVQVLSTLLAGTVGCKVAHTQNTSPGFSNVIFL